MPRRFKKSDRIGLFLAADGRCEICGRELERGWHADHVVPFVAGGPTDAVNGQALCPECNQKKGAKMQDDLLDWQREAFRRYIQHERPDFLLVATPGAGKTRAAIRFADYRLKQGAVSRLIIVVPTTSLRKQWEEACFAQGIRLDSVYENGQGDIAADMHGVVITYQQVGFAPALFRRLCRVSTMVILDEIHHAGEEKQWGDALKYAFEPAMDRLLLSGTPFRSDNSPIPFVRYVNGESAADYTYGYGEALRDQVCRRVMFPHFDGRIKWLDGFDVREARFTDKLAERDANLRLRMALDTSPKGDWLRGVLQEADRTLTEVRLDHPDAAGLVICIDQPHAKAVSKMLGKITGSEPCTVTSDDPLANDAIKRFRKSSDRWIVAVRMVSEGVDINRIRLGVYATNVLTEMFFRQAVGRAVRVTRDENRETFPDEQTAYWFLPRDERLLALAQKIKDERNHVLTEDEERADRLPVEREFDQPQFQGLIDNEISGRGVIHESDQIGEDMLALAEHVKQRTGFKIPTYAMAVICHETRSATPPPPPIDRPPFAGCSPTPPSEEKAALRKQINKAAYRLATLLEINVSAVHYHLSKSTDGKAIRECTTETLRDRIRILADMQRKADDGERPL